MSEQKTLDSFFKKSPVGGKRKKEEEEEPKKEEKQEKEEEVEKKKQVKKEEKEEEVEEEEVEEKSAKRRKTEAKGKGKGKATEEDEGGAADTESGAAETMIGVPKELANKVVQNVYQHLKEETWRSVLHGEFTKPYFATLSSYVAKERGDSKLKIYPAEESIFNALNACKFDDVKVVILGQDPYFNPGQAMGLSFSVPPGVTPPPSLKNMYKELEQDPEVKFKAPKHGDLTAWAKQGVLLLNTVLTVRGGFANSHQKQGWETFTNVIIDAVNNRSKQGVVFFLWGLPAQKIGAKINTSKHCVLKAAHPSPLSASKGFFGCKHFSKANKWLKDHKLPTIEWQL